MLEAFLSALLAIPLPLLVLLAVRKLYRRTAGMRPNAGRGGGGRGRGWPGAGDREPRRPKPFAGAGAIALDLPHEDRLADTG